MTIRKVPVRFPDGITANYMKKARTRVEQIEQSMPPPNESTGRYNSACYQNCRDLLDILKRLLEM